MDTSILPQDQSFGQKLAGESSLLNVTRMPIPRKRGTILWDRTLEDVFEDDDDEMEEQPSMSREEAVQENEGNEVVIAKEKYMVCARAILRIGIAWSLEAIYSSGFLHLTLLFFLPLLITLFYLNPVFRTTSGSTYNLVLIVGKL